MRWPIRLQIFLPFALLLAATVLGGAVLSSMVSARRAGQLETQRLARVVASLNAASFPYSPRVLQQMQGLSGAEFVAARESGEILGSTLPDPITLTDLEEVPALGSATSSLGEFPTYTLAARTFFVSRVDTAGPGGPRQLYVLYPRETWEQLQWDSAWPPLVIGAVTLTLMLLVSGWLAHRIGTRVTHVRQLFTELEAGRFPQLAPPDVRDELGTLVESANHLSKRLETLQGEIARTERLRTLAQLAGGLAHQLRNALTGARVAVQLHQRSCRASGDDDESLGIALSQLKLTEQQIQGLLSVSREPSIPAVEGELTALLGEVESLLQPQTRHLQIDLQVQNGLTSAVPVRNRDGMRGALLNLLLNAIEAAGPDGIVRLHAEHTNGHVRVTIADSGAGPPESIRDRLFEPFVTSKPEGVGLGLMLAQQAADEQSGTLSWSNADGETRFVLEWPVRSSPELSGPASSDSYDRQCTSAGGDASTTVRMLTETRSQPVSNAGASR